MAATRRLRLNFLGVLSLLIGVAACVAMRVSIAGYNATQIGLFGVGIGILGFLLGVMTGRFGSGTPVLGVIVSLAAMGLSLYQAGKLPWIDRLKNASAHETPAVAPVPTSPPNPAIAPAEKDTSRTDNIFDTPGGSPPSVPGSYKPEASADPRPESTPNQPASEPLPPPRAASAPSATDARAALHAARAKMEAAGQALTKALSNDPAYRAALAEADAADAKKREALAANGPGSPEVLAASRQWLEAKANLKKVIDAAAASDPAMQAAQRDLVEAEAAVRAARSGMKKQ
ncbi:MAG: hypothetical protein JWN24_1926 [Phycisphaerales bacterium]|nr:hypothetical protein [Phycisphaerales bacterium]